MSETAAMFVERLRARFTDGIVDMAEPRGEMTHLGSGIWS